MASFQASRDVIQGTKEWFDARRGKLTSSQIGVVLGNSRFKSRDSLAREYITGKSKPFVSEACQYGTEHEEEARQRYARWLANNLSGASVIETGFWANERASRQCFVTDERSAERAAFCRRVGGSPDGIVVDQDGSRIGCIEIKAPCSGFRITAKFKKNLQYMLQAQVNCWLLDVPWCDFIVWTPQGMGVWRIPRADTVQIPSAALGAILGPSEEHIGEFVRLGLYDPVHQTFRGYFRVLMEILWSFDRAAHQSQQPNWYQWGVLNEPHILMIKHVNNHVERSSHQIVDLEDSDMTPRGFVNWASWLRWKDVAPKLGTERPTFWGRYACLLPQRGWVHLAALSGLDDQSTPDEAYIDLYTMVRNRVVKRMHLDLSLDESDTTNVERLFTNDGTITAFVTIKEHGKPRCAAYAAFRIKNDVTSYHASTPYGTLVLDLTNRNLLLSLDHKP